MNMKIMNEDMTQELNRNELDFDKGYLKFYKDLLTIKTENGYDFDAEKDCMIYHPYTAEQLENRRLAVLRDKRAPLLEAFDKWEKAVLRNREKDDTVIMIWYQNILDLDEAALENIPKRIKYYL